jgi:outer membrane immunogenic protein
VKFLRRFVFALCAPMLVQSAFAADANWQGFYIGANAGYGIGQADNGLNINDGLLTQCHFCDNTIAGGPTIDHLIAQDAGSPRLKPQGFSGGLQLGYNWQSVSWVYGVEADFGVFRQRGSDTNSFLLPGNTAFIVGGGVCGATGPETCIGNFSTKLQTEWLLTVRPRLGYAVGDTLVYGTAGLAVTRLKFEQTYTDNITYPLVGGSTGAGGYVRTASSALRAGWVIGGGFERALRERWTIKVEYLYMRFAGIGAAGRLTDGFGGRADFSNNVDHFSSSLVRLGVNYKFDGAIR